MPFNTERASKVRPRDTRRYGGPIGRSPAQFPDYLSATAGATTSEHVNPKVNHDASASTIDGPLRLSSLFLYLAQSERRKTRFVADANR